MWITRKSKFISVVIAALAVIGPTIGASADSRGSDRDTATANGETSADEVAGNVGSTRTADRAAASWSASPTKGEKSRTPRWW